MEKKRGCRGEKIDFVPPACYNQNMAKVSYIDIDIGVQGLYFSGLKQTDRFFNSRVSLNRTILSRKRIKGLTARSLLPQIKTVWNFLSPSEQNAWKAAGAEMGLTGYRAFVKDDTLRIKAGLSGVATPSLLHQSKVGNLHIEAPADRLKIVQLHPRSYWVSRPVSGKKGMRELVEVTEDFSLPLRISLNYKTEFVPTDSAAFLKFFARVWSSYQGVDRYTELTLNLDFETFAGAVFGACYFGDSDFGDQNTSTWDYKEATISSVIGHIVGYDLYIHAHHLQGDMYFDNIKAIHSGQNWLRDTFCNDINQAFTKAFFQVPKHWVADVIEDGANFESIYKDF